MTPIKESLERKAEDREVGLSVSLRFSELYNLSHPVPLWRAY
jgi:hypothetical protein